MDLSSFGLAARSTGAPGTPMLRFASAVAAASMALAVAQGLMATPAHAAQTWTVDAGISTEQPQPMGVNQFGPSAITINVGDTVTWNFDPNVPHTVTFPGGAPEPPLFAEAPGMGPGDINAFPPAFAPAGPQGPGAQYNGQGRASSGFPTGDTATPYSLTFTAPGAYHYMCIVHPGMMGTVVVLPAGAALPETAAQASARGKAELNEHLGMGTALTTGLATERVETPDLGVNAVLSGANGGGTSAYIYAPSDITINSGDVVTWTQADPQEIHTITFLSGEEPPEVTTVLPQPAGPPSVFFPANVAQPQGGSVYDGTGYVNSGILGLFTGDYSWAVQITAPPGTYEYMCLIHPFMRGTITVQ